MRLSKRTDYALRAVFTLAGAYGGQPISVRELAARNDIPKRFLEQIMLDLKSRGWVDSEAGIRGGYLLAKRPEEITMGEIVRHFDGVLAPIGCVSLNAYEACSQEAVCRFRGVMLDVRNVVAGMMDRSSLADVMKRRIPPNREVFNELYIDGAGI